MSRNKGIRDRNVPTLVGNDSGGPKISVASNELRVWETRKYDRKLLGP